MFRENRVIFSKPLSLTTISAFFKSVFYFIRRKAFFSFNKIKINPQEEQRFGDECNQNEFYTLQEEKIYELGK